MNSEKQVSIVYTNYKGVTAERIIIPFEILYGHTDWHKQDQWLLRAFDIGKQAERTFAVKDIKAWNAVGEEE